jgi:hypothetical protein
MFVDWFNSEGLRFRRHRLFATATALTVTASSQVAYGLDTIPPPPELKNPSVGANLTGFFTSKTPYEFWLTCLICLFGLAVIYALLFGLRRSSNARPEDIARPIIVVTVITGTLMLITVGYNNEQIAPAFGLFGTIVGYMLGRYSQPTQPTNQPADQP